MTDAKTFLRKEVSVTMDRPIGSKHPRYGFVYELNYGFVPETKAPDGEELDAYVIGPTEPVESFSGTCIAIIHRTDDDDDKLIIVAAEHIGTTDDEIREATHFQEQFFTSEIWR